MSKRVTQQRIEISTKGVPKERVTQQRIEITSKGVPKTRVTQQVTEVVTAIFTIVPSALITQQVEEVISKVTRDFATIGDIAFDGSITNEALSSLGDANGDVAFDSEISREILSFVVDPGGGGGGGPTVIADGAGVGDFALEGSITGEILSFVAMAQGDFVLSGEMVGLGSDIPATCITGDGTWVAPTAGGGGNFTY